MCIFLKCTFLNNVFFRIFCTFLKCIFFNPLKTCENMHLKTQLGKVHSETFYPTLILNIFSSDLLQSLQSFFAACQISAGWKSERSSSNRSEVACADRRVGRLQWIKAWKNALKNIFHICFTFSKYIFTFKKHEFLKHIFHIFSHV